MENLRHHNFVPRLSDLQQIQTYFEMHSPIICIDYFSFFSDFWHNQLYNCLGVWFYDLMSQFFSKFFHSAQTSLQYIVYKVCSAITKVSDFALHLCQPGTSMHLRKRACVCTLFCLTRFLRVPPCNITSMPFE